LTFSLFGSIIRLQDKERQEQKTLPKKIKKNQKKLLTNRKSCDIIKVQKEKKKGLRPTARKELKLWQTLL